MNRFPFVQDHKDAYGVKRVCEVVEIARSSFYAWLAAAPARTARAADDAASLIGSGCCRIPRGAATSTTP